MPGSTQPQVRPDPDYVPRTWIVLTFVVLATALAAALPLWAYAASLAFFGLAHVLAELRYVDGRFGRRLTSTQGVLVLAVLLMAVSARALGSMEVLPTWTALQVELGLVSVLAFATLPALGVSALGVAVALGIGAAIAVGSMLAPLLLVVLLSVLHNLTPIGFLAERAGPRGRSVRFVAAMLALFVAVPLLIASGLPTQALLALGLASPHASLGTVGALAEHRGVFVPGGWWAEERATWVFAAVAYLQLLHYAVVIGVLPRALGVRGDAGNRPVLPWPRARGLALVVGALAVLASIAFLRDFAGTRQAYGVVAALHAWIEIPVLLLALGLAFPSRRSPAGAATT